MMQLETIGGVPEDALAFNQISQHEAAPGIGDHIERGFLIWQANKQVSRIFFRRLAYAEMVESIYLLAIHRL